MHLKTDELCRVTFTLNGRERSGYAEPRTLLSDFLRHQLGATGTRVGCEHGVCGACTVLVDGRSSRSCLMLAVQAEGKKLQTVESLASADTLNDLQQAFRKHHALQCGFCTAGILMSSTEFLANVLNPTEPQVRDMLSGHLCRCTGYTGIVNAVLEVAKTRSHEVSRPSNKQLENNNV
jgi:2-furoyl-CoA dehydrogenase 2Fe-2S iron sulfur subunit